LLTALAATGFIGGLGYMVMFREKAPVVVAAPPMKTPAPPPVAAEVAKAVEPATAQPREAAPTKEPEAPKPPPAEEARPAEAPKPVEAPKEPKATKPEHAAASAPATAEPGWIAVDARPFGNLIVPGHEPIEVVGMKTIPLKPGTYKVVLEHPKLRKDYTVKIESKKGFTLPPFRPVGAVP
jgi:hypothetical protein